MGVAILPFVPAHAEGVAAVAREQGWPSFSDPEVVRRACTAPGVVARVAIDLDSGTPGDDAVVGFAQACGDGVLQSFLSQLAVLESHRRRGIARSLVETAFAATGTERMDLLTDEAEAFYASFAHRTKPGFRIYPGAMLEE